MDDPRILAASVAAGGFALAFGFGWIASRTHFCTMGAISDVVNIGDGSRLRMWVLSIATAILLTNAMALAGWVDLSKSLYAAPRVIWFSNLVGGFLFGVGMTIASGCGARNLVRLGGGNLKSLVVLICLGLSAYMTMKGLLAPVRVHALERIDLTLPAAQSLPELFGAYVPWSTQSLRFVLTLLIGGALAAFALRDAVFRAQHSYVLGGVGVGLLVAAGWYLTGHIGYLPEHPDTLEEAYVGSSIHRPESFSFVGPVAYSLELLLLWTDASLKVTFGIAAVAGMVAGALSHTLITGSFRWEGFASPQDLRNHLLGGVLMGFGGVCALGCTIGQGITGISTLAVGSFITLGALVAGSVLTMKWLYWRMERTGS
jgi:uncharacterized protein